MQRSNPGAVDITGTANSAATVSVNEQAVVRKGDYFYKELAVDNSAAPVNQPVNVVGARQNFGAGGEDAVTAQGGRVFVPQAVEAFTYDADGNMASDGRWVYTWDGENRLTSMEALASVPAEAKQRLEFAYDYMGRRVQKSVYGWNVATSSYQMQAVAKFIYDGASLIAELDGNNVLIRDYVWGQDISGTLQGAGGVGGLLFTNMAAGSCIVGFDGTENVTTLVRAFDGSVMASYEYDPFGNILKAVGLYAASNPFRFSTKYTEQETGLVYYGYRYYCPGTGRWLSRDPLAPANGINLYAYVVNSPINFTDPDGLQVRADRPFTRDKGRRYDDSSPNWDFATGSLDHTYHSITLCIPKLSLEEAMSKIFQDLLRFEHFEPNIARMKPVGANRGHFEINDPSTRGTSELAGNSIDVIFYSRSAEKTLFAVTTGNHPLVGVRLWQVYKAGTTREGTTVVNIVTEAYDQANGSANELGRALVGRDQQRQMWRMYLTNIARYWQRTYKANVIGRIDETIETDQPLPNPFKSLLPSELQRSKYIEYDYILP